MWSEARHPYSREDLLKHRCGCRCPFGRFTSCTQGGSKYNVRQSQAAPFPSYPTQAARCNISLTCYGGPLASSFVLHSLQKENTLYRRLWIILRFSNKHNGTAAVYPLLATTTAAAPADLTLTASTPPFCMQASKASTLTSDQRTMLTTLFELLDDNKDGKLVSNHHLKPCHAQHSLT